MWEFIKVPVVPVNRLLKGVSDKDVGILFRCVIKKMLLGEDVDLPERLEAKFDNLCWYISEQLEHPHRRCWDEDEKAQNRRDRSSVEYMRWRRDVFVRDGFQCQICNKIGGMLNAHHIKPFSKYKELRFDVDNGITVCVECHKDIHWGDRHA